jgi:hypothetical protein
LHLRFHWPAIKEICFYGVFAAQGLALAAQGLALAAQGLALAAQGLALAAQGLAFAAQGLVSLAILVEVIGAFSAATAGRTLPVEAKILKQASMA